ncbi:FeoB-associated Cys-rich membrane protein [Clostridium sp. YIM B02551]|nr:FeoB-associated Cys-rich membrane protein [Clostridium sp. YIM B02551]
MVIQILITVGILAFAIFTIYNKFKKKSCGCGGCKESKAIKK